VLTRWRSGFGSVVVVLVMLGLVIGDLTDGGLRRWWTGHALTTDTVAGLLVLLVTVLVVDQVVSRRRAPGQSTASSARLDQAVARLRAASAPLLRLLNPEELIAAGGDGSR
jgi:hypothetical protein